MKGKINMNKIIKLSVAIFLFAISLNAADLATLAKDVYAKGKGNKTESQWTRYFKNPRWQAKLGIEGLSDKDRSALLVYLNEHSADKDQATVPK